MKLLTGTKAREFEKEQAVKKEEARLRKTVNQRLRTEITALNDKLDKQSDHYRRETDRLINKHEDVVAAKDREISLLKTDVAGLSKNVSDDLDLKTRLISIEAREKLQKAKETEFDKLTKDIATQSKKLEESREEGIQKGYADGLADGLREATKITAEDRKMAMQVALVSAASHTPEAATEIAKNAAQDVARNALGTGNDTPEEQ